MCRSTIVPRRPLAGLVLLVQLAVLGAWLPHVPDDATRSAVAHIEAAGASDCPQIHDEGHCGLCQSTTLRVVVTQTDAVRVPPGVRADRLASPEASRAEPGAPSTPGSRAPPPVPA